MPTSTSALPGTTILNLPIAVALDGSEWAPLVQSGTTKRAQTGDISGILTNLPLVLTASAPLGYANARQLAVQGLVTLTDGGGSSNVTISLASTGLSVIGTQSTASSTSVGNIAGTADQILRVSSAGSSLAFGQINLGSSNAVSSVLGTNFGGTGSSAFTPYQLIIAGSLSSSPFQNVTPGTSGFLLTYVSSTAAPTWQAQGTVAPAVVGNIAIYTSTNTLGGATYINGSSGSLTLGLASSATGKVLLASSAGGTTTIQPANGATFNFNLSSGAGTAGQPLLSGGGGAANQTYGTLLVPAGGTGGTAFTAFQVLAGGTVSSAPFQSIVASTSPGFVLTNVSSNALPTWQDRGAVSAGTAGQVAYYSSNGTSIAGSSYFSLSSAFAIVTITSTQNASALLTVSNTSTGAAAFAAHNVSNSNGSGGFGLGGSALGGPLSNRVYVDATATVGGIIINNEGATPTIFGTNSSEIARFSSVGNLTLDLPLILATSLGGNTTTVTPSSVTVIITGPITTTTLIGKDTVDTLTGKVFDTAGSSNSLRINGTAVTAITGSSNVVLGSTPTISNAAPVGTWTSSGTWTLGAHTLGGTVSGGGNQVNNVVIGAVTPLAGTFTVVTSSVHNSTSSINFQINSSAVGIISSIGWTISNGTTPPAGTHLLVMDNVNTVVPTFGAATTVLLNDANGTNTRLTLMSFSGSSGASGTNSAINYTKARGTAATPTSIGTSDNVGTYFAHGYSSGLGAYAFGGGAGFSIVATDDFSSGVNCGLRFDINATPTGTNAFRIAASFGRSVMAGTQTDGNNGEFIMNSSTFLMRTKTAWANGAGATTPTITNAPSSSPTKWIPIDDNGTTRFIPAW